MKNKEILEARLNQIVKTLESVETLIDNLDFAIPKKVKETVLKMMKSEEINEIITGIKEKRPPRLVLTGRTGVGKSSLINAIFGKYLAKTSAIEVGTKVYESYNYESNGEVIFEIIDTRGIKESLQVKDSSAEDDFKKVIEEFEPDAFLLLTNGADRSTLKEDSLYLKEFYEDLEIEVPLVTVITRIDDIEPSRIKEPDRYTEKKKANIKIKEEQVRKVLNEVGINDSFIIPVSSYIEWSHEEPEILSREEQSQLTIEFDGRYNIDKLVNFLEENMDFRAAVYLILTNKIEVAIKKIANRMVKSFSMASAAVAVTPIPLSDIAILLPIQIIEVTIIAYINGKQINGKAAREFIVAVGGVAALGVALRFVAQQGAKLLNFVVPSSGSVISSAIAYSGTYAIGQAAIAYYIDGKTTYEAKGVLEKSKKEAKDEFEGK
ncbi:50S ribosome-binding GTPase [Bacillus sp. AGMB 02131]|uniref:50S ribosome-binding GTPase n=1 Tax=Peribacillus faecalis TaxID=2772559 RepID=A0A927CW61_9BACI|nr:GTPase [Peribacillus faecalis]MBD3108902.1 50S ribosome-binding GTPase [Peribacillus faecalis]